MTGVSEIRSTFLDFFRKAIAFTRRFPILQQRKFFLGHDLDDDDVPDLTWFAPDLGRRRRTRCRGPLCRQQALRLRIGQHRHLARGLGGAPMFAGA